jgi:hypothetical protein
VDSYAAFLGREPDYVNVDGLHLTPAGYQALAAGFFVAIQSTVEQIPVVSLEPLREDNQGMISRSLSAHGEPCDSNQVTPSTTMS